MQIGRYQIKSRVVLAPMAGVTDLPFRQLCRRLSAGLVVSEMVSANPALRNTRKTQLRLNHAGEPTPIIVQIAGGDPEMLAEAARFNVDCGADIIDINMGCPAKKVCHKAAGSALLKDERLVASILSAVVNAVSVPVTLKIRTGWEPSQKNALRIAALAESCGIQALAVHGRTRADFYQGAAEYETIAAVKSAVKIPVIANGDIDSPEKAKAVLAYTQADAVMIGRAAQGRPWIFQEIDTYLRTGRCQASPTPSDVGRMLQSHLSALYAFYGEYLGVRIARKHVGWYCKASEDHVSFRRHFNTLETAITQQRAIAERFDLRGV